MADEAAVPIPEEELPEEEEEQPAEEQDPNGKPKPKGPVVRYGQLLMLGNDAWTVKDGDKDGVTLMRRIGNMLEERRVSPEEFEKAKTRPVPSQLRAKGSAFAARGLADRATIQLPDSLGGIARISGYDAVSGEVQLDVPGRGATWVARNTVQDLILSEGDREKGIESFAEAIGEESPAKREAREKKAVADRKKKAATPTDAAAAAPPATPLPPVIQTPGTEPTEIAPETTQVRRVRRRQAADAADISVPTNRSVRSVRIPQPPASPSVSVSPTIAVGGVPAAASAPVAASVTVPTPSIRETRSQLRTQQAEVAAQAPAKAAGGISVAASAAAPMTAAAGQQVAMYARAVNALQVMAGRVASQRNAIQEMQGRTDQLRQTIAGLNAQSSSQGGAYRAPADVSVRIQSASRELGELNNRLATARYQLQADDARVQQLQIGTNLMRNSAKETASGQLPQPIVAMIVQSIPADIPDPSQARLGELMSSLSDTPEEARKVAEKSINIPTPPTPRSYSAALPAGVQRPVPSTADGSAPLMAEQTRQRLQRGGLALPQATAVAFSAAQQADRAGGDFQEGLGAPDAQQAAYNTEGSGPNPVMKTVQRSYAADLDQTAEDEAADYYDAGRGGTSSEFTRQQQELRATQEQFLPGTTPNLGGPAFTPEATRSQRVRTEPELPAEDESARMAAYDAAVQRARAASFAGLAQKQDDDKENAVLSAKKAVEQTEAVRRNISRMVDLFNAAIAVATVETIIGAIWEIFVLLANMNGRLLSRIVFRDPKSLARKLLPAAQFPYEFAAIVSVDLVIASFVFLGLAIIAAFIVIIVVTLSALAPAVGAT